MGLESFLIMIILRLVNINDASGIAFFVNTGGS